MTPMTARRLPMVYARVAGTAYLITMALGIFSVNFVESRLIRPGQGADTIRNIMENELLFRIGIASEIAMYALVVLLAFSLYMILNMVNRNLALLALLWRLGEAIVGAGLTVVSGLIPLLLLQENSALDVEVLRTLSVVLLNVRGAGLDVVLIYIGMGGTVYCYLFFRSGYVPKILAAWGMVTYVSMLVVSFLGILSSDLPESVRMAFYAPGGLFEIVFGLWLLLRGVNIDAWKGPASAFP